MKLTAFKWFMLLLFYGIACKKTGDENVVSPNNNPINDLVRGAFTVIPFDTSVITGLVPLGNLNPPAHTFPTDHMYFYCYTSSPSLNIKSPGNVKIFRIGRTRYNAGLSNEYFDYNIAMGSEKSFLYWGHVSNLSARLLSAVNNFNGIPCQPPYSTGGANSQQCYANVSLDATPGEVLGIAISKGGFAGMDFGATVNGMGAEPLQYFDAKSRSLLEPKLGRYDGKVKRTALPLSGEFNLDLMGTAQGNWIKQGSQRTPEDNNIALVKDNIDPSKQAFSAGISLPGLPPNVYYFIPQQSGFVNRSFADVKPDLNFYCYSLGIPNFPFNGNSTLPATSIIIRLDNANTLSAEKRNCDCTCLPYAFTGNKVTYTR